MFRPRTFKDNMKSIEWYKEKYKSDSMDLVIHSDGRVEVPLWLKAYILRKRGLKSKKGRIIKKVINKELTEIILQHLQQIKQN